VLDDNTVITHDLAVLTLGCPTAGNGTAEEFTAPCGEFEDLAELAEATGDEDDGAGLGVEPWHGGDAPGDRDHGRHVDVDWGCGWQHTEFSSSQDWARMQEEDERDAMRALQQEAEAARQEAEAVRLAAERKAKADASRERISAAGNTWHKVLGVPPSAPMDVVKRAYHELALLHHPDKGLGGAEDEEIFKLVQWAYEQGCQAASSGVALYGEEGCEFQEGSQVIIDGLGKRPDLNGQWAACQAGVDATSGRLEVVVASGETVRVKPENLTKAQLSKGLRVRIVGLGSEQNGLVGVLVSYDAGKDRWSLEMPDKTLLRVLSKRCVHVKDNAGTAMVTGKANTGKWSPDALGVKRGRCNKCSKCPCYKGGSVVMKHEILLGGGASAMNCLVCGCRSQDHERLGQVG